MLIQWWLTAQKHSLVNRPIHQLIILNIHSFFVPSVSTASNAQSGSEAFSSINVIMALSSLIITTSTSFIRFKRLSVTGSRSLHMTRTVSVTAKFWGFMVCILKQRSIQSELLTLHSTQSWPLRISWWRKNNKNRRNKSDILCIQYYLVVPDPVKPDPR